MVAVRHGNATAAWTLDFCKLTTTHGLLLCSKTPLSCGYNIKDQIELGPHALKAFPVKSFFQSPR